MKNYILWSIIYITGSLIALSCQAGNIIIESQESTAAEQQAATARQYLDKSNQTEETVVIVEDGETNQARERQLDARSYIEPSSKPRLDHNGNMILIIQTGPATTSDNASTARSKAASYIASSKKGKCTAAVESDVGIIDGIASDDSRTSTNSSNRGSVALTNCR